MNRPVMVSDAAYRCSEVISGHTLLGHAGRWAAVRLADGRSNGVAYDTRADAIRDTNDTHYAYVKIPVDGMPPEHAERFLRFNRQAYDAGFRLTDPDDPRHLVRNHL